jgi:hypothetical protein
MPQSPCNKHLISARRQSRLSRHPGGPIGQLGRVQETDVCCTGLFGINHRPANCVFLMAGERVQ